MKIPTPAEITKQLPLVGVMTETVRKQVRHNVTVRLTEWQSDIEEEQRKKCGKAYADASKEYQHGYVPAIAYEIENAGKEEKK